MQRIISFILNNRTSVIYLILLLFSLILTFRSHSYHQSKVFNSSKWLTGTTYKLANDVSSYFGLRETNQILVEENRTLRRLLFNKKDSTSIELDTTSLQFEIITGRVINNNFTSPRNYLTINKGKVDGVKKDMGVITSKGILGIVENTSNKFATVQSVLNTKSSVNAKIKNTDYFGSLVWDARDYNIVQLADVPRSVPLVVGDTIVTGGMSSIFPEGIPIGTIKKYDLNQAQSFFNIEVELFNDMPNLGTVYLIKNYNKEEIDQLENQTLNGN